MVEIDDAIVITGFITGGLWLKHVITNWCLGIARSRMPVDSHREPTREPGGDVEGGGRPQVVGRPPRNEGTRWYQMRRHTVDNTNRKHFSTSMWKHIVNNDLENIPLGVIIAWASVFVIWFGDDADKREDQSLAHIILFGAFALGRLLHSLALFPTKLHARSMKARKFAWAIACFFYFIALLAVAGMLANLIIGAWEMDRIRDELVEAIPEVDFD